MMLDVSPAALAELAKVGFDPVFGVRPLERALRQRIENPVSKLILQGRSAPKEVIPVGVDKGEFVYCAHGALRRMVASRLHPSGARRCAGCRAS